jgi:hypothetical protein
LESQGQQQGSMNSRQDIRQDSYSNRRSKSPVRSDLRTERKDSVSTSYKRDCSRHNHSETEPVHNLPCLL